MTMFRRGTKAKVNMAPAPPSADIYSNTFTAINVSATTVLKGVAMFIRTNVINERCKP